MNIPAMLANYPAHLFGCLMEQKSDKTVRKIRCNLLDNKGIFPELQIPEQYRKVLYRNPMRLARNDWGAGSKTSLRNRTVAGMARTVSVNNRDGQLLFHLARYVRPAMIIELGTAFGLSTMYLALGNPEASIVTVEGNSQLADLAAGSFKAYGLNKISLLNHSFDEVIPDLVRQLPENFLVFIDGNHTLEATLRYYHLFGEVPVNACTLVFDDINWSRDMMKAWKVIRNSETRGLVIDLFKKGIIFRGQGHAQQKIRLCY